MTNAVPSPSLSAVAKITVQATAMLDLMLRLADLLAHETKLVRAGRVANIAPLQEEKLRQSARYQKAIKELEASGAKIVALPAPLRAQIVAASNRLAAAVSENERALRVGRAATRRLLDMVVESVRAQVKPLSRYTARLAPARHAPRLAVTVDRRL